MMPTDAAKALWVEWLDLPADAKMTVTVTDGLTAVLCLCGREFVGYGTAGAAAVKRAHEQHLLECAHARRD
jgi:hypothetical protein